MLAWIGNDPGEKSQYDSCPDRPRFAQNENSGVGILIPEKSGNVLALLITKALPFHGNAQRLGPVSKKGTLGVISNPQLVEQAARSGPESQARKVFFDIGWINGEAVLPRRSHGLHNDVSILKFNRLKGVSGFLDALNLGISAELRPAFISNVFVGEKMEKKNLGRRNHWQPA